MKAQAFARAGRTLQVVTRKQIRAMSLAEVMIASVVLLVAILTMVGYTVAMARTARESKSQALASMYARTVLERMRDSRADFDMAHSTGLSLTEVEVQLTGEAIAGDDEVGREGAIHFEIEGRALPLSAGIFSLVVRVNWQESGRTRTLVLESRAPRPAF